MTVPDNGVWTGREPSDSEDLAVGERQRNPRTMTVPDNGVRTGRELPQSAESATAPRVCVGSYYSLGCIAICPYKPRRNPIYNHLIISDINRGAVTVSVTPHWRRRRLCGDAIRTLVPTQPRRGCRPSRHAIVPDVVLASKVEAIRNGIVVNCTLMLVVLAFQNKAIRNAHKTILLALHVVLAFQIKAIRNGYELVLGQHGCISLSN